MLLAYRKILFLQMVNMNVLVILVVHSYLLHLFIMTTSVSLVVQDILTYANSTPIVCGMVSSVEQSREGVVELLDHLPWFHKTLSTPTSDYITETLL